MSAATAYTQRVKVGAVYTDGKQLYEVTHVNALGSVSLATDWSDLGNGTAEQVQIAGMGIDAFRRRFWLVKAAPSEESDDA